MEVPTPSGQRDSIGMLLGQLEPRIGRGRFGVGSCRLQGRYLLYVTGWFKGCLVGSVRYIHVASVWERVTSWNNLGATGHWALGHGGVFTREAQLCRAGGRRLAGCEDPELRQLHWTNAVTGPITAATGRGQSRILYPDERRRSNLFRSIGS